MMVLLFYEQGIDPIFHGFKRNGDKPALIISMAPLFISMQAASWRCSFLSFASPFPAVWF
jgi:hypothetical protein